MLSSQDYHVRDPLNETFIFLLSETGREIIFICIIDASNRDMSTKLIYDSNHFMMI